MNLVPRNQLFDIDSLFNNFFQDFSRPGRRVNDLGAQTGLRVDVHEAEDRYEIHADLPGVKKDDIEITLHNDVLTVSARKNTETEKSEQGKVIWRERSSGSISRSFSVSPGTSQDDISADFKDGVLTLTVRKPQPEQAEPSNNRIPIG